MKRPKNRRRSQHSKPKGRDGSRTIVVPPYRVAPAFSDVWNTNLNKVTRKFSDLIKDQEVPIESFVDEFLEWMNEPVCSFEPYAFVIKRAFGIHYHKRRGDMTGWENILPRVEEILRIADERGSEFCRMILHETVGHRYLDFWLNTKDPEYEDKMKQCYLESNRLAKKLNCLKNIDSSLYWLAEAYKRAGRNHEAHKYYCAVANRKGRRFAQSLHMRKVKQARKECNCRPKYKRSAV